MTQAGSGTANRQGDVAGNHDAEQLVVDAAESAIDSAKEDLGRPLDPFEEAHMEVTTTVSVEVEDDE